MENVNGCSLSSKPGQICPLSQFGRTVGAVLRGLPGTDPQSLLLSPVTLQSHANCSVVMYLNSGRREPNQTNQVELVLKNIHFHHILFYNKQRFLEGRKKGVTSPWTALCFNQRWALVTQILTQGWLTACWMRTEFRSGSCSAHFTAGSNHRGGGGGAHMFNQRAGCSCIFCTDLFLFSGDVK